MARYAYRCNTINCELRNIEVIIEKSMQRASEIERCQVCGEELQKIFSSPGIKTSDGIKT